MFCWSLSKRVSMFSVFVSPSCSSLSEGERFSTVVLTSSNLLLMMSIAPSVLVVFDWSSLLN